MSLSIEDRIAIHQLYPRWCALVDCGDYQRWSECFTENGVFDGFSVADGRAEICRGRAEIAAKGKRIWEARQARAFTHAQHWNGNILVEGTSDHVRGMCYILLLGRMKSGGEIMAFFQGWYLDELVKQNGRWLIANRRIRKDPPRPEMIPRAAS